MKVFNAEQIRNWDKFTIENEPVSSLDLMERAARRCYKHITKYFSDAEGFYIFSGIGNNGGDGLAIARMLHESDHPVTVFICGDINQGSSDFQENFRRLKKIESCAINIIEKPSDFPPISQSIICIDAIIGTGINRPLDGLIRDLVIHLNNTSVKIVSIDMPSGLHTETAPLKDDIIVKASLTISFQVPKPVFFHPSSDIFLGRWILTDIGLHQHYYEQENSKINYTLQEDAEKLLMPRGRFSHKGKYGHALLAAGSFGKMGAAVLAARAATYSGCGLLTAFIPECGIDIMQISVPEAMVKVSDSREELSGEIETESFSAIGVGPGIGKSANIKDFLKTLFKSPCRKFVIDADALNLIAENPELKAAIPAGSILTPHPVEFGRLAGNWKNDNEKLQLQTEFSSKHQVILVLKGAFTCITDPLGNVWYNASGNPGMAKGGSGDALTGVILSLLAQGYSNLDSSILGVYVHGLAGDIAAKKFSEQGLSAGDTVNQLRKSWKMLSQ